MTRPNRGADVDRPTATRSAADGGRSDDSSASTAPNGDPLAGLDLGTLVWRSRSVIAVLIDVNGLVGDANPTFQRLAGRDPRGEPLERFVGPGQVAAFAVWLEALGTDWSTHTWGLLPNDAGIPRDVRLAAFRRPGGAVALVGEPIEGDDLAAALLDVNETILGEQRRLMRDGQRLGRVAQLDALTGIANRRALDAHLLDQVTEAGSGARFAIVMLDLDHFKDLNDRLGHQAGDAVLKWLGAHLRSTARRGDFVARYGGEEFMAILSGSDVAGADRWAERLRGLMAREPAPTGTRVTASMGIAEWRPGDNAADLIARADRAMYAAKRTGRDRIVTDGADRPDGVDGADGPGGVDGADGRAGEPATAGPDQRPGLLATPTIALAMIEDGMVLAASEMFERRVGGQPIGRPAVQLVHGAQAAAFDAFLEAAGSTWTKAAFGFNPDARGIPADHATWARRRSGRIEILIEPAVSERVAVEETLLALVDDMIEIQRELQLRTASLERANAARALAELRASELERLLPLCAWCGRIRTGDTDAARWVDVAEYLQGEGVPVTHGICDRCDSSLEALPPASIVGG